MEPSALHALLASHLPLQTARLSLRLVVASDASTVFALWSDPQAARYGSRPAWTDAVEADQLIERDRVGLEKGEAIRLGLVVRETGDLVGCCSVFGIDWSNRRAELGYILLRSHWGRGLMHEALTAVTRLVFDALTIRRLEADIDPRNRASMQVVERLGFVREGLLRDRWLVAGEVSDTAFYGLLATDPRP